MTKPKIKKIVKTDLRKEFGKKFGQQEKFRQFVEETVRSIMDECHLAEYTLDFKLSNKQRASGRGAVYAEIVVSPDYLRAAVTLRPEMMQLYIDKKYDRIREVMAHEMAHINVEPLAKLAEDRYTSREQIVSEVEKLTERLSRYMFNTTFKKKN
jgi:hypothetical protein